MVESSTSPAPPEAAGRAPAADAVVAFADVAFAWPGSRFAIEIADFTLKASERLLLLGPSGSGKSTFLSLLAGINTPDRGTITVLGQSLGGLSGGARDRFRAEHFGIIFQMFNLLPYGSVIDNVMLPLHFAPERRRRAEAAAGSVEAEARRLLAALGLEPSLITGTAAASLSVGQQQRVAAARALIGAPRILVADEPASALDRPLQAAFVDLLFKQAAEARASLIMVSHDPSLADHFDRTLRLDAIARTRRGGLT